MPKIKKPKKCKCGEDNPKAFYRTHTQCKKCTAKFNRKRYMTLKKQKEVIRQANLYKSNDRCIECPEMSVSSRQAFFKFCSARREIKKSICGGIPNCGDCGLGKKVDGGFLPVNIVVM